MHMMLNVGWPMLIAGLSILLTINLSNFIFFDILGALQTLACAAGCCNELHLPSHVTLGNHMTFHSLELPVTVGACM